MDIHNNQLLHSLSKEELIELIEIYSKNWLAMDGVWFQSVENRCGMQEAMYHDAEAWRRFTVIEAKKIKNFLKLPEKGGIEGLKKALSLRFYAHINDFRFAEEDNVLYFSNVDCRVQTARRRKNMEFHPCKTVGIIEYSGFAKVIDERFQCECVSCYPEVTDEEICCGWKFILNENNEE